MDKTIFRVSVREAFSCMYVPLKCHFFCLRCTRSTYRYVFLRPASEHNAQHRRQTVPYSSRAESVVNPSCIQLYNPAVQQQQQHSGQPRARMAGLHAAVFLWLYMFFPGPRSIIPPQRTSLSDAVRDRAIVQYVGAIAHSSATPATDINTCSAESVLTAS